MTTTEITSKLRSFNALTTSELYDILRLRSEVFVMEQSCLFLDQDNKDQKCHHLMLFKGDVLVGYSRIVPKGLSYLEVSIGRVVTSSAARGSGLGRKLMELSIASCYNLFGAESIQIGAQLYAKAFYESLGFVPVGAVYEEDGIDHVDMIKEPV